MGMVLRVLVIVAVGALVMIGLRRIWRDWTGQFREIDKQRHKRDVAERARPDVVTLERGKDGTFRPPQKTDQDR